MVVYQGGKGGKRARPHQSRTGAKKGKGKGKGGRGGGGGGAAAKP